MPPCGWEFACWHPATRAATAATNSAPAVENETAFPVMTILSVPGWLLSRRLHAHRGRLRGVLAVFPRELLDQAFYAVVAHDLGEGVAVGRGEARAGDTNAEHLPSFGSLLHVVVDRHRLRSRLPDLGPDDHPLVPGLGPKRLDVDRLVAIVRQRRGIGANQQRPEFERETLLLLWRGAPPVGA